MRNIFFKMKCLLDKYILHDRTKMLFLFSMFFLITTNVLLFYNFDFTKNNYLLFGANTGKMMETFSFSSLHDGSEYPLFVLFLQPIFFLLKGFVFSDALALILLFALASSFSVIYIYKIFLLWRVKPSIATLFSFLFLFSFSNYIGTMGAGVFTFATLFFILFCYFLLKKIKKNDFNKYSYFILVLLATVTLVFSFFHFFIICILLLVLCILKKVNLQHFIGILFASIIIALGFNLVQKMVWHHSPFLWESFFSTIKNSAFDSKLNIDSFISFFKNFSFSSIMGNDIALKILYGNTYNGNNYMFIFKEMSIFYLVFMAFFYGFFLFLLIRNCKKNMFFYISAFFLLFLSSILAYFFFSDMFFASPLLCIFLFFFGILFHTEKNMSLKKYGFVFLVCFVIVQIFMNSFVFLKLLKMVREILNSYYLVANLGLVKTFILEIFLIFFITTLLLFGVYLWNKCKKERKKERKIVEKVGIIGLFLTIQYLFIALYMVPFHHKLFFHSFQGQVGEVSSKNQVGAFSSTFTHYYSFEMASFQNYVDEYNHFLESYDNEKVTNLNESDYYYFGFGNRRKLMYKENCLIDVFSKEKVYTFKEKEHLIVPNLYSVLIKTTDNTFIKIYEDEKGVHLDIDGKDKIIDGTKKNINLYDFKDQKYSNIKKVLYGEILFNIKDSTIYPNIIVYDKPWYRDGALASMVLKQTKNMSLIQNWVSHIEDLYDRQNAGIEEADNLGELLYILSTQEKIDYDLVDRIEKEAEKLASQNKDGYYLNGKTDFADMPMYQNLWYELGIRSVHREFKFDLENMKTDGYTAMAWWSKMKVKEETAMEASKNYPYLSFATRHKLGKGKIAVNKNLYPLSFEAVASQADYTKYDGLDSYMKNNKISPLHTWAAAEFLLFLMDETGDLKFE